MTPRDRPRVIANFALTADGKTSTRNFTPTGFTSKRDFRELLRIRSLGDALLVGRGTLEADNMSLTLPPPALRRERRERGQTPEPLRCVLSGTGTFGPAAKFFTTPGAERILFTTPAISSRLREQLAPLATLHVTDTIDLPAILHFLRRERNVRTLVCEGGPTLFRALVEHEAIDELYITRAPLIFGGHDAPTLTGQPGDFLPRIAPARLVSLEVFHDEAYLHYRFPRRPRA